MRAVRRSEVVCFKLIEIEKRVAQAPSPVRLSPYEDMVLSRPSNRKVEGRELQDAGGFIRCQASLSRSR